MNFVRCQSKKTCSGSANLAGSRIVWCKEVAYRVCTPTCPFNIATFGGDAGDREPTPFTRNDQC